VRDVIFTVAEQDQPIYILAHSQGGSLAYDLGLRERNITGVAIINSFLVEPDRYSQVPA